MLLLFELFSKEKIKVAAKKIEEFGQKSLCFEKDFLNKYLQSNYNFGELFENKMYGIAKNE